MTSGCGGGNANIASLVGANRDYILNHIPHISRLMVDSIGKVLAHAETIVIGNSAPEFKAIVSHLGPGQALLVWFESRKSVPKEAGMMGSAGNFSRISCNAMILIGGTGQGLSWNPRNLRRSMMSAEKELHVA